MDNGVLVRWLNGVSVAVSAALLWTIFIRDGVPRALLALMAVSASLVLWTALSAGLRSGRSMRQVIAAVEAEPARVVVEGRRVLLR